MIGMPSWSSSLPSPYPHEAPFYLYLSLSLVLHEYLRYQDLGTGNK